MSPRHQRARDAVAGILAICGVFAVLAALNGMDVWRGLLLIGGMAAIWTAGSLR